MTDGNIPDEKLTTTEQQQPKNGRDLTVGSIPRNLILFSLPMLAGNVLQTGYSLLNAFWVGQYLGKSSLAAVGVSFPVIFVLIALAFGLTMASNILISQYAGAREWEPVKRVVQTSTVLILVISLIIMLMGEVMAEPILRAMHTPATVLPLAVSYMHIMLLSLPLQFIMFLIASMMRGVGDSTTPLYFQSIFLVVTAILDPVLMLGWLGAPRLGLNGTAVATLITMTGAIASLLIYLQAKGHIVAPNWRRLSIDWGMARLIMVIGLPSALQGAFVSISSAVVISLVNHFGENTAAAFTAGLRIDQVAYMPAMAIGMAVSTFSGQNIGARLYHRVRETFWWAILISGGITLVLAIITFCAPAILISMFVKQARDPQVFAIGVTYLRYMAASYVIYAVMFASNGVINGAGHTTITTIFTLISLWGIRVPLAALLSGIWANTWHLPAPPAAISERFAYNPTEGIWAAMVISVGIGMCISLGYFFSGRWKKVVIKHRPPIQPANGDEQQSEPLPLLDSQRDA